MPKSKNHDIIVKPFDSTDIQYLGENLTPSQLRYEVGKAEAYAKNADIFADTEYLNEWDLFPWADFANCCRAALLYQKMTAPAKLQSSRHHISLNVEAIKSKNDIVTVIEGYTKLKKSGKNFTGCCPIHQEKNPSLTVYPDQQSWHCYGCNRGGDVISFIQEIEKVDFRGAAAILGGS